MQLYENEIVAVMAGSIGRVNSRETGCQEWVENARNLARFCVTLAPSTAKCCSKSDQQVSSEALFKCTYRRLTALHSACHAHVRLFGIKFKYNTYFYPDGPTCMFLTYKFLCIIIAFLLTECQGYRLGEGGCDTSRGGQRYAHAGVFC